MPAKSAISSTEKLLELIRRQKTPRKTPGKDGQAKSFTFAGDLSWLNALWAVKKAKSVRVGVEFDHEHLRLLKIVRREGKVDVAAWKSVPVPEKLKQSPQEVAALLRSALVELIGGGPEPDIVASIRAPFCEMRLINVPKVPKHQLAGAVFWSVKKETPFDEKASFFDFEDRGEIADKGVPKISTLAYIVPKDDMDGVAGLFDLAGYTLAGLTIRPFATQSLLRAGVVPLNADESVATLHIGRAWSRIDIFQGGNLVLTRGIKAGMSGMEQALLEALRERAKPSEIASPVLLAMEEEPAPAISPLTEPVLSLDDLAAMRPPAAPPPPPPPAAAAPGPGPEPGEDDAMRLLMSLAQTTSEPEMDHAEILTVIMPAAERMIRQVEMTFKHFRMTLGNEPARKLFISGPLSASTRFVAHLGEEIGMECTAFDPLGSGGSAKLGEVPQIPAWERLSLDGALGLAVSDNHNAPNLLFTFKQRLAAAKITLINKLMAGTVAALLVLLAGVFGYQMLHYAELRGKLTMLKTELSGFNPQLDLGKLNASAGMAKSALELKRAVAERRIGMAAIAEISELTPDNIKIISLNLDLGKPSREPPRDPAKDKGAPPPPAKESKQAKALVLEGVVLGGPQVFEAALAGYLVKLRASVLFSDLAVDKRNVETLRGGEEVLRFVVSITLA